VLAGPGTLVGVKAVLFVVPGSAEIRAVLGDGGLLRGPHDEQVLIDLTTSDPAATREIAAQARETGRDYLDCGMTGGAKAADAGTITLMVGGESAVLEACRPLLGHRRQGLPCRGHRRPSPHEAGSTT
jgi:3-hydroxyisobutyrate dehydrogenase